VPRSIVCGLLRSTILPVHGCMPLGLRAIVLTVAFVVTGCRGILGIHDLSDESSDGGGALSGSDATALATSSGSTSGNPAGQGSGSASGSTRTQSSGSTSGVTDAHIESQPDASSGSERGDASQMAGQAELTASPTSFVFSNVALFNQGTLPTTTITVSNGGGAPSAALTTGLTFANGTAAAEFKITADSCNGQMVQSMSSCAVTVQFQPTMHGAKSAALQINGGALSVMLSGVAEDELLLTVTKAGNGGGTVADSSRAINCGATCSAEFTRTVSDPIVALTATPDANSTFAGWSDGCTGSANPCMATLDAATSVTAQFSPVQETLTVRFSGLGSQTASIASSPAGISCSGASCTNTAPFDIGSKVTLTVTQGAGAIIAWSASGCSDTTCSITMSQATTVNVTTTNQNIAFTTSKSHSGNFGGLAGASAFCNSLAVAVPIPGHFQAFLGTSTSTPFDALGAARGWIRPDGLPFTDTVAALKNGVTWYPLALSELGLPASTNFFTGYVPSETCGDWTSTSGGSNGGANNWNEGASVFDAETVPCSGTALLCFGTDFSSPVSETPVPGRHIFVTSSPFSPDGGIATADALCQSAASSAGLANPTRFLALLATTTASAASRFNLNGPTWVRTDGVPVAASAANFMSGQLMAPTAVIETGAPATSGFAWIGSSRGLTVPAQSINENCNNWSSASGSVTAAYAAPQIGWPGQFVMEFSPLGCNYGNPVPSVLCLEN
jgi:List-Bact-rpt repeat protein